MKLFVAVLLYVPLAALAQAPRIAEIRGNESLLAFLQRLPGTFEAQIFYALVLFGLVGVFVNYFVRWLKKDIAGSLFAYLFRDNVRGTLLSFVSAVGTGLGGISIGFFETPDGQFIGWMNTMIVAFGNGFFWDTIANKGQRPVWTPEQRAAATKQ